MLGLILLKLAAELVRVVQGAVRVAAGQIQHELVAHHPAQVAFAPLPGLVHQKSAEFFQQLVAGGIAVFLVEVFEVLEVAVEDLVPLGIAAYDLVGDLFLEAGKGQQTGQPVKFRGRHHAAAHGVHSQVLGEVGIDDLGDLAQFLAVLVGPVALAAAHHIGNGTLILALGVHGRVHHRLGVALHQQRSPGGGEHVQIVRLQHGGAVFVVALEQGQKIFLGKAGILGVHGLCPGRGPLELGRNAVLVDLGVDDGDAVQLQPDAYDL